MKMQDTEFEAIVTEELQKAANFIDEELGPLRATATEYYYAQPLGNEEKGRSQMVSHDVRDTVNAMLPSLMKVFFGSERVVEYTPVGPEDEAFADQATDFANYILQNDNDFFSTFYAVAKDALIRKCGIVKVWQDEKVETTVRKYKSVEQIQLLALQADEEIDVEIDETTFVEMPFEDEMGQMQLQQLPVYDVTVTKSAKSKRIYVREVPPEELLVCRSDRFVGETFVAHRQFMTVSDLVAMGYERDEVERHLTHEDSQSFSEEAQLRSQFRRYDSSNTSNPAMRRVEYAECYVRIDADDSGIAKLHKVCVLGKSKVLNAELCDYVPFALFPCDPEPHLSEVQATSKADDLIDIQRVKTAVWRNSLDALAQSLNPRMIMLDGGAYINDLLNNEVGGVIRETVQGAVRPIVTPDTSLAGLNMLGYIDEVKESRVGMSRATMGLDPKALQSTSVNAANAVVSASQQQLEMTARILANGMKSLFKLLLKIITTHADKERVVRLRNEWVAVDPSKYNPDMDVKINVALGTGTEQERFMALSGIAQKQEMLLQMMGPSNPIVSIGQYSHTLSKLAEVSGFQNASAFFNKLPQDYAPPPSPPPVDPNAQATELLAKVEMEKAQMKMQVDQAKMEADAQFKQAKLQLDYEQQQADFARKQLELEVQQQKFAAELQLKEAEMVLRQLTDFKRNRDETLGAEGAQAQQAQGQDSLMAQAIAALGNLIVQSQSQTVAAIAAPKKVLRDDNGLVSGVEIDADTVVQRQIAAQVIAEQMGQRKAQMQEMAEQERDLKIESAMSDVKSSVADSVSAAIQALGGMIAQTHQQTLEALSAPKRVLRDEQGRIAGVAPVKENDGDQ